MISVIGDGALTGGMAYEALNNAAELKKNFVIVLNDNNKSISNNVGGMSAYLGNLRTAASYADLKLNVTNALKESAGGRRYGAGDPQTKSSIKQFVIPGMLFENMGLTYLGPGGRAYYFPDDADLPRTLSGWKGQCWFTC